MRSLLVTALLLVAGCGQEPAAPDRGSWQPPEAGELAFIRCRACHSIEPGDDHGVGPNLAGLFGREAGSVAGFRFSDELAASKIVWDAGTLAAWITDPVLTVPGTTMVYPNDLSGDEIVALVAYLEAQTGTP